MVKKDVQKELVAATNDSSIKSKRSMVRQGYVKDPYGRAFVPNPSRRSPLINRGYYIRDAAVSNVVHQFLSEKKDQSRQIISVGAGFDTTFFRLESMGLLQSEDKFFEIDFPSVMQRKVEYVNETPELCALAPYLLPIPQVVKVKKEKDQKTAIKQERPVEYSKGKLVLVGCDLAQIDDLKEKLHHAGVDLTKPTLILSECVLTYMFPGTSSNVIQWGSSFSHVVFVMYEQSFPHDGFGQVMTKHFDKIGSSLRSIEEFPSIPLYVSRFQGLGWDHVQVCDMNELFYNVLEQEERNRIAKLEPFDEYEEWHLKCSHYFVLVAQNDSNNSYYSFLNSATPPDIFRPVLQREKWQAPILAEKDAAFSSLFSHQSFPIIEPRGREETLQRWSHGSARTETTIVAFGGFGGTKHSRLNDVCFINPQNGEISNPAIVGVAPKQRVFPTLTHWKDEKLLLFGGRAGTSKPFNDCFELDVEAKTWRLLSTSTSEVPEPRWRHSMASTADGALVIGGRNQDVVFSCEPWLLDASTPSWQKISTETLPSPRHSHSCTRLSEFEYIMIGGIDECGMPLNECWQLSLNDTKGKWTKLSLSNPIYRYSHTSLLVSENKVLLIGGVGPSILSEEETFLLLDLTDLEWRQFSSPIINPDRTMLNKQTSHYIDGKIILIGGGGNCFSFGSHFNRLVTIFSSSPFNPLVIKDFSPQESKIQQITGAKQGIRPVKVVNSDITSETYKELMKQRKPFIVRGNTFGCALEKWKDSSYLKERCGDTLVSVHKAETRYFDFVKKNYSFIVQPFSELIANTLEQSEEESEKMKFYLRSLGSNPRRDPSDVWESFPELMNDFQIPSWFPYAFPSDDSYFSSVFRIGSKDMQLWTHYDMMDNILCHVVGKKNVSLWSPSLAHRMQLHGSTSEVTFAPDEPHYPSFPYDEKYTCSLEPGDVLFIPSLWFHNIHAETPSISLNLFWRNLPKEFYETKDLFGNRDLPAGVRAMEEGRNIERSLQSIPEEYRDFYARLIMNQLSSCLSSPL